MRKLTAILATVIGLAANCAELPGPCGLTIVERGSGRVVPALMFHTSFAMRCVTDNDGAMALDAPDILGKDTWFGIEGNGYGLKKDFIGNAGFGVKSKPGGTERREVDREMKAVCLGRLTGSGIFAESQKLGRRREWREPGDMRRYDVQCVPLGRRVMWIWNRAVMADGSSACVVAAATSAEEFPPSEPPVVPSYKPMSGEAGVFVPLFERQDWEVSLSGAVQLPDSAGNQHLVAVYTRHGGDGKPVERGLCEFSRKKRRFQILKAMWERDGRKDVALDDFPVGHAVRRSGSGAKGSVLFCNPFPSVEVPLSYEAWRAGGKNWKRHERPDVEGGARSGSMAYVPAVRKWVAVYQANKPGELRLAKSASPFGPWETEKIVSFGSHAFENPVIHGYAIKLDSRSIFFEGTLTNRGGEGKRGFVPRILDNQLLYRIDIVAKRILR